MKKLIYLFLLTTLAAPALGQKLEKYEDVLPRILTLPTSGALAQLKIYLAAEPENPSIYLQMAVLYESRYRNSDVIKDHLYKTGNAREALGAYQIASRLINEKEVKRNSALYFNFGSYDEKGKLDVPYDTIANKLATIVPELTAFLENAPVIYEKFTQSYSHYDRAHKLYTAILGEYPTFKDLYLLFDASVDARFEEIKKEYLEALQYWEEYQTALANYDIGYHQTMKIEPIKVYRLDGMEAKINFLTETIHAWDYAEWVDNTRANINLEIKALRTSLVAENLRLDKKLQQAQPDFIREEFEPAKVSKEVLFTLRKYDLNSVIEPIFIFKEKKHDLIYQQLLSQNLDTSATVDSERKLYLYGQMVNRIKEADTVLNEIRRRNTQASLEKYNDFISTYYKDQSGITQFVTNERQSNQAEKTTYIDRIQNGLYDLLATDTVMTYAAHKSGQIPLLRGLTVEDELLTKEKITTQRIENFDGSLFVGGIFKNEKEGKTQAFVAGITKDQKVGWYNEYLLQIDSSAGFDANTRLGALQSVPGGVALVLHGVDTNGTRINHLMILEENGDVKLSRRISMNGFPRTITYEDRNNSLLITFKGEDYLDDLLKESELIVANYNILGDLLWQQRLAYKGDITSVIGVDRAFLVFGNYNEIRGLDGRIQRAGSSNTDSRLFALKLSQDKGEIENLKTFAHSSSYVTNQAHKVSDDCINLFGSVGGYAKTVQLDTEPGSAVHIMVNKDLEILSNTLR